MDALWVWLHKPLETAMARSVNPRSIPVVEDTGREMSFEIHRSVQNPHDLELFVAHPEKDHMLALGSSLAVGKEVVPEPVF